MPIEQRTPTEAKEILDQDPNAVYLDVRSVPEFTAEHAEGAINIPLMHKSPVGMEPNPDFLQVSLANLPKDKTLVVGCLKGGRSLKACQILEQNGYSKLYNVLGGFGGNLDPITGENQTGWKDSGLPTSQDNGEGVSYESLKSKA